MIIKFSIVIPLYNKERYIEEALTSIINQAYPQYEIIVINDGSTDHSLDVVKAWLSKQSKNTFDKVTVYSQQNRGVSAARNKGVELATFDYIAFLDADDFWQPSHLTCMAQLVKKYHHKVDIFSTAIQQIINGKTVFPDLGRFNGFQGIVDYFEAVLIHSAGFVNSSSVCVKKSALVRFPFPEDMRYGEDRVTFALLANKKGFAFCPKIAVTQVVDRAQASLRACLKDFIEFRRLMLNVDYDKGKLKKYLRKQLLLNILYARFTLSYFEYFKQTIGIFGEKGLTGFSLLGLIMPKFFLKILKSKARQFIK